MSTFNDTLAVIFIMTAITGIILTAYGLLGRHK